MPSLKTNAIMNFLRVLINIGFPLLTFPYASRLIGPDGIGAVNYSFSFVETFLFISTLGIPIYGIREIAKVRNDDKARKTLAVELLILNSISAVVSFGILIAMTFIIDRLSSLRQLVLIQSIILFLNVFCMDWYFQGKEAYTQLLLVNIVSKILSAMYLFFFVKDASDLPQYALFMVMVTISSGIFNFAKFYFSECKIKINRLGLLKHIPYIVSIFFINISISLTSQVDRIMIGTFLTNISVGYYVAANKIIKLGIFTLTSVSTVLIPRISFYIKNTQNKAAENLISKSIFGVVIIGLMLWFNIEIFAEPIIIVLSGQGFHESILLLQLLAPLLLVIPISNIFSNQILFNYNKEKVLAVICIVNLIINIVLNLVLIHLIGLIGVVIATLVTEIVSAVIQYVYIKLVLNIHVFGQWKLIKQNGSPLIIIFVLAFIIYQWLAIDKMVCLILFGVILNMVILFSLKKTHFIQEYLHG